MSTRTRGMGSMLFVLHLFLPILAGIGCTPDDRGLPGLAIVNFVDSVESREVTAGAIEGLAEMDIVAGEQITLSMHSAGADYSLLQAIAQNVAANQNSLVITFGTPATQALFARCAPPTLLVFGLVTDPVAAGLGRSAVLHPAHVSGYYGTFPTVEALNLIRQTLPDARQLGVVWNNSEVNSAEYMKILRAETGRFNLELLESPVAGTSEIHTAAEALAARGADVFFCAGDSTVIQGFEALAAVGGRRGIPVFANVLGLTDRGAVMALGRSFHEEGLEVGRLAGLILRGEIDPSQVPFRQLSRTFLRVNRRLMQRYDLCVPQAFHQRLDEAPLVTE